MSLVTRVTFVRRYQFPLLVEAELHVKNEAKENALHCRKGESESESTQTRPNIQWTKEGIPCRCVSGRHDKRARQHLASDATKFASKDLDGPKMVVWTPY